MSTKRPTRRRRYAAPDPPAPQILSNRTAIPIGVAVAAAIFGGQLLSSYLTRQTRTELKVEDMDGLKPVIQEVGPMKAKVGAIDEKVAGLQTWTQNLGKKLDEQTTTLSQKIEAQKDAINEQKVQGEKILGAIGVLNEKVGTRPK